MILGSQVPTLPNLTCCWYRMPSLTGVSRGSMAAEGRRAGGPPLRRPEETGDRPRGTPHTSPSGHFPSLCPERQLHDWGRGIPSSVRELE